MALIDTRALFLTALLTELTVYLRIGADRGLSRMVRISALWCGHANPNSEAEQLKWQAQRVRSF